MARKKISFPDYAWWRMDDPHNLMVITGLMTFDTPLDYERLKATMEQASIALQALSPALGPARPSIQTTLLGG